MKKIMIIEDDAIISKELYELLVNAGYEALILKDFSNAKEEILKSNIDLILLDINIPYQNGEQLLKEIRKESNIPVIMVTSRASETDEILSISYGADDYITKPFNILEVKARIKAIMRRVSKRDKNQENEKVIVKGEMKIDCESRRVIIGEKEINLTAKEFDLLELLAMNPGKVYSRENLLNIVWGYEYPGDARTVDVHIRRLREKIETNPSDPKYVYTKWGVGYYFRG